MGRVIMSGFVPTLKAPGTYNANFADNDWATIIKACHKNQVPETWVVGNQKAMMINGADYVIDIIGKEHDDYADGSGKAPLTLQLHDCYGETKNMNSSNTNEGGWTSCAAISKTTPVRPRKSMRRSVPTLRSMPSPAITTPRPAAPPFRSPGRSSCRRRFRCQRPTSA